MFCRRQPARAGAPLEHVRRAAGARDEGGTCETQVQGLALFRGTAASLNKARRIQGLLEAAHRHGLREGAKPLERSSPRVEQAPQGSGHQRPSSAPGPVWGGEQGCSPATAVAGPSPALMGKGKTPGFLARLRGQMVIHC